MQRLDPRAIRERILAGLVDDQPLVGPEPQRASGLAFAADVFGFCGRSTPSALDKAATEAAGARSEMRSAGGSTAERHAAGRKFLAGKCGVASAMPPPPSSMQP